MSPKIKRTIRDLGPYAFLDTLHFSLISQEFKWEYEGVQKNMDWAGRAKDLSGGGVAIAKRKPISVGARNVFLGVQERRALCTDSLAAWWIFTTKNSEQKDDFLIRLGVPAWTSCRGSWKPNQELRWAHDTHVLQS